MAYGTNSWISQAVACTHCEWRGYENVGAFMRPSPLA